MLRSTGIFDETLGLFCLVFLVGTKILLEEIFLFFFSEKTKQKELFLFVKYDIQSN